MKRETVYSLESLYRGDLSVESFTFGGGSVEGCPEKAVAIVGALRGDEVQQLFIASQLVHYLQRFEAAGLIAPDALIRVIPCGNPFSLNTKTRFWAVDNTDINRMFPGFAFGETTQRIADGIFRAVKGFGYGVQLASYYLPGSFLPHVRVMDMEFEDVDYDYEALVNLFGLPYAVIRRPEPVDVGTLNYNWQVWETLAVSIHSRFTTTLNPKAAEEVVFAVLRLLIRLGLIEYDLHGGFVTTIVKEDHLVGVASPSAGLLERSVAVGDHVETGQVLARVFDPLTGDVRCELESPSMGVVFFSHDTPLVTEGSLVFRIIDDRVL